ncbi:MAG: hypothetical protein HYT99_09390 [Candidatus Tectomicrobia bacterium]|nr:hypothetical protein [Candidatus Tectomicrobia bacterium]
MSGGCIRGGVPWNAPAAALAFAGTPEQYDEALQNFRIVLLMVDLHHPALGGAAASDLVRKLRANPKNKGAYAMAWGAHTEVDLLKGAERAGFDKVLARSAFVREMPEIVRRAVSRIRTG